MAESVYRLDPLQKESFPQTLPSMLPWSDGHVFGSTDINRRSTTPTYWRKYSSVDRYNLTLTQSSSLPLEHKAPTSLLELGRSWTSQSSSIQVSAAIFISSATVLLQVPSGLPLSPDGVQLKAACGRLSLSIQRTWPSFQPYNIAKIL